MNDFVKGYLKNKYKAQGRFDLIKELNKPVLVVEDKKKGIKISVSHINKMKNLEKMKDFLNVNRSKIEIQSQLKMSERSVLSYMKDLRKEGKVIEEKVYSGKKGGYSKLYKWEEKR